MFTVSVDEKTGIQALERISPTRYMLPGSVEKREFEYKRHGTLCLTPSFNIVTGKIISHTIDETRDEIDFYEHIRNTVETSPNSTWIFVADQLTTHKSESLVRYIAEQCGIQGDLGVKRKRGILENVPSRQAFLTDASHRIRFVFTPKHCSWLNQVEIWFGILSRKLINQGSFTSKDDLRSKLNRFIDYFNENLAKPYRWTYKGKALAA
ncbi:MAG: IS630 family transposase [Gammaproteobacteria bacterium]|nr:MAG: IS630 family transposase [Gammaproteobacteria bacterium]